jgi:peptidoglycan/xylan/chitin deacetylase (PgdA/CDA1 family)
MRAMRLLLLALMSGCVAPSQHFTSENRPWTFVEDAPVRGNPSKKQIALIFTGGDYGEGTAQILDTLAERRIKASFFVTGGFLRQPALQPQLKRMIAEGHYLGPHSDSHPLYSPWDDRSKSNVSKESFKADLRKNIDDLRSLGALKSSRKPTYFIPPYEWYNATHSQWAREEGVLLFNFSPGSGSNRDYAPEGDKVFVPSTKLIDDILAYERKDPHGLNGFLLLLHLGSQRKDKVPPHVDRLLDELQARGYAFVKVNEMLR